MTTAMTPVDVREATHIEDLSGKIERIACKWGIDDNGHLAKPSDGGFGVVTVTGRRIGMFAARRYWREDKQ